MLSVSWRTSLAGVIALCAAIGSLGLALSAQFDGNAATVANWDMVVTNFGIAAAAFGLMNARDNKVSTKEVKDAAAEPKN